MALYTVQYLHKSDPEIPIDLIRTVDLKCTPVAVVKMDGGRTRGFFRAWLNNIVIPLLLQASTWFSPRMELTMISELHYMFLIPFLGDVSLCPALRSGLLMFEMRPRLRGSFLYEHLLPWICSLQISLMWAPAPNPDWLNARAWVLSPILWDGRRNKKKDGGRTPLLGVADSSKNLQNPFGHIIYICVCAYIYTHIIYTIWNIIYTDMYVIIMYVRCHLLQRALFFSAGAWGGWGSDSSENSTRRPTMSCVNFLWGKPDILCLLLVY